MYNIYTIYFVGLLRLEVMGERVYGFMYENKGEGVLYQFPPLPEHWSLCHCAHGFLSF